MRSRQAVIYTGAVRTREARAITDSIENLEYKRHGWERWDVLRQIYDCDHGVLRFCDRPGQGCTNQERICGSIIDNLPFLFNYCNLPPERCLSCLNACF
jgi:hypothetical protein